MQVRDLILALLLATAGSCAIAKDYSDTWSDSWNGADDSAPTDQDDTGGETSTPVWLSLTATFTVLDGVAVSEGAVATWEVLDADKEVICTFAVPVEVVVPTDPLPDESLFAAWSFTLGEGEGCSRYQDSFSPSLDLAIGAMSPDIAAVIGSIGYDGLESNLYTAFTSTDSWSETIWAFGVAATEAGYAGEEIAVSEGPLPDGDYTVTPVYLLPF